MVCANPPAKEAAKKIVHAVMKASQRPTMSATCADRTAKPSKLRVYASATQFTVSSEPRSAAMDRRLVATMDVSSIDRNRPRQSLHVSEGIRSYKRERERLPEAEKSKLHSADFGVGYA